MNPTKQNPFSIYDFLGYFVPGAFAIYIYFVIRALKTAEPTPDEIEVVLNELAKLKPEYIIPFLIVAYIFGHLLSYVSSITIEQYANWKYNYPSRYLLKLNKDKNKKNYKGLFVTSKDKKSNAYSGDIDPLIWQTDPSGILVLKN